MKILITENITVTVQTNSEHGEVDAVWLNGKDISNLSVAEAVVLAIGPMRWREKISQACDQETQIEGAAV